MTENRQWAHTCRARQDKGGPITLSTPSCPECGELRPTAGAVPTDSPVVHQYRSRTPDGWTPWMFCNKADYDYALAAGAEKHEARRFVAEGALVAARTELAEANATAAHNQEACALMAQELEQLQARLKEAERNERRYLALRDSGMFVPNPMGTGVWGFGGRLNQATAAELDAAADALVGDAAKAAV